MILLHGSNRKFNEFKVGKEYSKSDFLMEGLGIYMTENQEVASSYGRYMYNVFVNENDIFDATDMKSLKNLFFKLGKGINIPLEQFINIDDLIIGIQEGDYSITGAGKEICDLLDSNESFYGIYQDRITYDEDCMLSEIVRKYKELLKPVIKYKDKSLGIVYIGIKQFGLLEIIGCIADVA